MSQQQQDLVDFIAAHHLTMAVEGAASNPSMGDDDWGREANHYVCTLHGADGASMAVTFSMGSGLKGAPSLEMVLDALSSDIASVVNAPDWLDWAEEMGYEGAADLRRARSAHEAIGRQAEELRTLLGEDAFEALLWNTERL